MLPALALLLFAQDPPPPPLPEPAPVRERPLPAPGRLPEDVAPEARAAWERVCAASLVAGSPREPVRAFELVLDVRVSGGSNQTSDLPPRTVYRYLAPSFVRIALDARDLLRGPRGDFLVDRARGETLRLDVGREHAEDRRQLDETLSVARNFVALTDPGSLRIESLALAGPPELAAPAPLRARALALEWVRLVSPDFRLVGADGGAASFRVWLGCERGSGVVEQALVEEDLPGGARPSAKWIELRKPRPMGRFRVPQQVLVHGVEEGEGPARLGSRPALDLWVVRADLAAALKPEHFLP